MTGNATGDQKWRVVLAEDNDDHALLIQMALERAAAVLREVARLEEKDFVVHVQAGDRLSRVLGDKLSVLGRAFGAAPAPLLPSPAARRDFPASTSSSAEAFLADV